VSGVLQQFGGAKAADSGPDDDDVFLALVAVRTRKASEGLQQQI
jgi:hypothetical protein